MVEVAVVGGSSAAGGGASREIGPYMVAERDWWVVAAAADVEYATAPAPWTNRAPVISDVA